MHLKALEDQLSGIKRKNEQIRRRIKIIARDQSAFVGNYQRHMNSWSELTSTMDSKIDHISRSQLEQLSSLGSQISNVGKNGLTSSVNSLTDRMSGVELELRKTNQIKLNEKQKQSSNAEHVT